MSDERIAPRRVTIPFLSTTPVEDLRLGMVLLPMWWLLGVEQFIWLPLGLLAFLKHISLFGTFPPLRPSARFASLFVISQLASACFIEEPFRLITFARNWLSYVGALLWLILISAHVRSPEQARRVLSGLAIGLAGAGILGLAGILGIWRPQFVSPIAAALPAGLKATTYGRQIAERNLGSSAWFVGVGEYFRVESVFTFATFFAYALVVGIPIVIWLRKSSPTAAGRRAWTAVLVALIVNIVFTTGRVSVLSLLLAGAVVSLWLRPRLFIVAALAFTFFVYLLLGTRTGQNAVRTVTFAAAYARGGGSVEGRGAVYRATIAGIMERPWFGWGTERDIPGHPYPAGSHSYYLGMLYKHGLFGAVSLALFLVTVWRSMRLGPGQSRDENPLVHVGRWVFLGIVLNGVTDVLDLDVVALVFAWAAIAVFSSLYVRPVSHAAYVR